MIIRLTIRRAEAADAALALRQLVDLDRLELGHPQHDELCDPHAGLDHERLAGVGVEQDDPDFAAIALVDQPGRVHDGQPVPRGQPGARLDEACMPFGDRDREAGADERPLPRSELVPLAGGEIEPGIPGVGALGKHRVRVHALDRQLDHALVRASASAIRNGAKRRTSRRGNRARTKTPSGRSARSSTGVPSA